jgi:23S rRNA (uridine2552-2'-O)-methyltransferase
VKEVQDHWFREAKAQGYRSRAAFKLLEIDRRKRILRRGMSVLDVGAAPGSWTQVAAAAVGPKGRVVGFDLKVIDPAGLPPQARVLTADLREVDLESLGGRPFDVVLSDMAPDTTGDPSGDQARSARLCHELLDRMGPWLRPGGTLVYKVFEGGDYPELLKRTRTLFEQVKGFKPPASRAESVEMYVIAEGRLQDREGSTGESSPADPHAIARNRPRGWGAT